ncbi:TRAP transporter permease [Candidatus Omnitrophota bacterium]
MERSFQGKWLKVIMYLMIASALFHFIGTAFGYFPDMQQRALHITFAVAPVFLMYNASKHAKATGKVPVWDLIFCGLIVASTINVYLKYIPYHMSPTSYNAMDMFFGIITIVLVVEAGRRVVGWVFPMLTSSFIVYALFGPYIPGDFGHGGVKLPYLITHLYQTDLGIWGFTTGISATIAAIFMILGGLLLHTGIGDTFMALSLKAVGRVRGGAALSAVMASSLFGTISGGASTNVVATGNVTIPMMKKLGYKPEFAAGVETTASTGGPIMPPIMGLAAFIMAEFLGISYLKVIIAGIIPAALYYLCCFSSVRFESLRLNLAPIPAEEIPSWRDILTWAKMGPLIIPFVVLLWLLVQGSSIATCGFWAVVSLIVLHLFANFSLAGIKQRFRMIIEGMGRAGKIMVNLAPLLVCANIAIGLITLTGLGVKIGDLIISIAGGSLLLSLVFTAIAVIIFGMGVPITAAYILAVAVLYPSLELLGLPPIVGHYFIMYYAAISAITPPVCMASFVAAAIAETHWMKVAWVGMRLGAVVFFLPFIFTYEPALLIIGNVDITPFPVLEIVQVTVTAVIATIFMSGAIWGYLHTKLSILARLLFLPGAFLLLIPGSGTDVWGGAMLVIGLIGQTVADLRKRRLRNSRNYLRAAQE